MPTAEKSILALDQSGELCRVEESPESEEQRIATLEQLCDSIDRHCEITPCPRLVALEPDRREELVEAFGREGAESILLATEQARVLWTDDHVVAGLAQGQYKVRRVWTQVALHASADWGKLDWQVFNRDAAILRASGYEFTWWNPDVFETAANEANWDKSSYLLRPLLDDLGSPTIMCEARLLLSATVIRSCYGSRLTPVPRNAFVVTVLSRLARLEDDQSAAATIYQILRRICVAEPHVPDDARRTFQVWLQARRTGLA